ncbi:MAG TPA: hypothetical protein VMU06_23045 [Stellaceae bacterium]|nr:hypothetical protein [Stellaceae bacterium]
MEETSDWPSYHTGPKDSTFVLGVISATYGRLEHAFSAMFVNTTGVTSNFASILLPKISNDVRTALMEETLPLMGFTALIEEHIRHFIARFKTLVHNRNMLMHSQIFPGGATTAVLIKTQRDGKVVGRSVTLAELRQIADDMEAFREYGIAVANHIALPKVARLFDAKGEPPPDLFALPRKPDLPARLDYTSDPIPLR